MPWQGRGRVDLGSLLAATDLRVVACHLALADYKLLGSLRIVACNLFLACLELLDRLRVLTDLARQLDEGRKPAAELNQRVLEEKQRRIDQNAQVIEDNDE
jgi:hypothetical protein